jgi:malate synthase
MEEILYELRDHAAGSERRALGLHLQRHQEVCQPRAADFILPDRGQVTMTVPFMRAYTELLVHVLPQTRRPRHRRHGGLHPQPPRPVVTENALRKVREDKLREFGDGCDGTWVAHPDLVPTVLEIFNAIWAKNPTRKSGCVRMCRSADEPDHRHQRAGGRHHRGGRAAQYQRGAAIS